MYNIGVCFWDNLFWYDKLFYLKFVLGIVFVSCFIFVMVLLELIVGVVLSNNWMVGNLLNWNSWGDFVFYWIFVNDENEVIEFLLLWIN